MRTFDAARINSLINHPEIRPFVGGDGKSYVDVSVAIENRQNIFLLGEHGGLSFGWSAPRIYEIHTFILPDGRGKWARDFVASSIESMRPEADMIWARIQPHTRTIRLFALKQGFQRAGDSVIDLGCGPVLYETFTRRF